MAPQTLTLPIVIVIKPISMRALNNPLPSMPSSLIVISFKVVIIKFKLFQKMMNQQNTCAVSSNIIIAKTWHPSSLPIAHGHNLLISPANLNGL